MKRLILIGAVALSVGFLGSSGLAGVRTTAQANPLTSVRDLGKGKIAVHFRLPSSEQIYGVRFASAGGALTNTVSLNPYGNQPAYDYVTYQSRSLWLVNGKQMVLLGNTDYNVFLLFAPKARCKTITAVIYGTKRKGSVCTHIEQSPPYPFHLGVVGSSGPGTLIGRASDEGIAADPIVSGSVPKGDSTILVRVSATPNQDVHINWDAVCASGMTVKSASGGWDDTTPVNDSLQVTLPIVGDSASCQVTVGAPLLGDQGGFVTLSVYASF